MRRPEMANTQKRNRARLRLRKSVGKRSRGRLRSQVAPGLPAAAVESASTPKVVASEPMRCAFGALRVGPLLARLRLHLQTDRFLAVHRGDAMWEAGCLQAALVLADIVAGMREAESDAPLPPQRAQLSSGARASLALEKPVPGTARCEAASHTSECELWGTRKTGTATLARCSAALERGAR